MVLMKADNWSYVLHSLNHATREMNYRFREEGSVSINVLMLIKTLFALDKKNPVS